MNILKTSASAAIIAAAAMAGFVSPSSAAVVHPARHAGTYASMSDPDHVTAQDRCDAVERHYANYPQANATSRNDKTLVPGDASQGRDKAWQLDLAIASSPICRS